MAWWTSGPGVRMARRRSRRQQPGECLTGSSVMLLPAEAGIRRGTSGHQFAAFAPDDSVVEMTAEFGGPARCFARQHNRTWKPRSTGTPPASAVSVCPPHRSSASNRVTLCLDLRNRIASAFSSALQAHTEKTQWLVIRGQHTPPVQQPSRGQSTDTAPNNSYALSAHRALTARSR
jgi:hypothetical protein